MEYPHDCEWHYGEPQKGIINMSRQFWSVMRFCPICKEIEELNLEEK